MVQRSVCNLAKKLSQKLMRVGLNPLYHLGISYWHSDRFTPQQNPFFLPSDWIVLLGLSYRVNIPHSAIQYCIYTTGERTQQHQELLKTMAFDIKWICEQSLGHRSWSSPLRLNTPAHRFRFQSSTVSELLLRTGSCCCFYSDSIEIFRNV